MYKYCNVTYVYPHRSNHPIRSAMFFIVPLNENLSFSKINDVQIKLDNIMIKNSYL